ncbi:hypothetical protein F2Q70_00020830 [Brassica cretica]|uniref:Uncharacterized protein n=1 Tax=Brassica cretica TaxID=69181 RepID=A0A8S9GM10_BRACR|nr:hypothetical protein F2Q70_00020830 [Brassica cretica]KAF2556509.1 hypothetical protein F2Q68_00014283 [Brassica cretica]
MVILFAEAEPPSYLAIALASERAKKRGKGKKKIPPLTLEQAIRKERMEAIERGRERY